MQPRRFEIYYGDGSCRSGSTKADWKRARDQDVQWLVVEWQNGSQEKIAGQDEYELFGYVKHGRWTSDQNYRRIQRAVDELSPIFNPSTHKTA